MGGLGSHHNFLEFSDASFATASHSLCGWWMIFLISSPPQRHQKANFSNSQLDFWTTRRQPPLSALWRVWLNPPSRRLQSFVQTPNQRCLLHFLPPLHPGTGFFSVTIMELLVECFSRLSLRNFCKFALTHQTEQLHCDLFCFSSLWSLGSCPSSSPPTVK